MRTDMKIDSQGTPVDGDEMLIRLLCSPLQYDKETRQVSIDAFNLRMMGKNHDNPEHFASLGRRTAFGGEDEFMEYLQKGYSIWNDKEWEENEYYGHGTFLCKDALTTSEMVEIHPLKGAAQHIGMFYAKNDDEYYKGPLPKDQLDVFEMLSDLAGLISDTVVVAPARL